MHTCNLYRFDGRCGQWYCIHRRLRNVFAFLDWEHRNEDSSSSRLRIRSDSERRARNRIFADSPFLRQCENERMGTLEEELQKIYDSEIRVHIGWLQGGGIDVSIGHDEVTGNVQTVAEVLPWLQEAIAKHFPDSKYNVERKGGTFR